MKQDEARAIRAAPGSFYFASIRRLPPRPLHSDADLVQAVAVLDELLDREGLDGEEADDLDVLGDLVRRDEQDHSPIPSASDANLLLRLIEARGSTQAQVDAEAGVQESALSEVLSGRRGLSRANIGRLARHIRVSPAAFRLELRAFGGWPKV